MFYHIHTHTCTHTYSMKPKMMRLSVKIGFMVLIKLIFLLVCRYQSIFVYHMMCSLDGEAIKSYTSSKRPIHFRIMIYVQIKINKK